VKSRWIGYKDMIRNAAANVSSNRQILVTGFDGYGKLRANPSAALVRRLADEFDNTITAAVLPTSYQRGARELNHLLESVRPDALLMFGYSSRSPGLRLERRALNADRAKTPDVDGVVATSRPIFPGRPASYDASAPVAKLHHLLDEHGLPVTLSESPGGFVCNHLYCVALHDAHQTGAPAVCLFVHVPRWEGTPIEGRVWEGAKRLTKAIAAQGPFSGQAGPSTGHLSPG
jgi:pyroglutamyl-peptidase